MYIYLFTFEEISYYNIRITSIIIYKSTFYLLKNLKGRLKFLYFKCPASKAPPWHLCSPSNLALLIKVKKKCSTYFQNKDLLTLERYPVLAQPAVAYCIVVIHYKKKYIFFSILTTFGKGSRKKKKFIS